MKIRHQDMKNVSIQIGSLGDITLDENGEADVSEEIHDYIAGKYGYESLEDNKQSDVDMPVEESTIRKKRGRSK